jgi:hypothetical protein
MSPFIARDSDRSKTFISKSLPGLFSMFVKLILEIHENFKIASKSSIFAAVLSGLKYH